MLFGSYEGAPIVLDRWQAAFLRDPRRYVAGEKAPQIGASLTMAMLALWEAMLISGSTTSFVSVDQREAANKIVYAKRLYYELPEQFQSWVKVTKDSVEEFGISDRPGFDARLLSIPNTSALRGRKTNVVLDECDFYRDGGESSFRVSMGRIQRGGWMRMFSTCFGVDTQLDRVMQGEDRNFARYRLPWTVVENADALAAIEIARQELSPDDFAEEYECIRGGGSTSFGADLLRRQMHGDRLVDISDIEDYGELVIGADIGTAEHPTVCSVLERHADGVWRQSSLTELRHMSLPKQTEMFIEILSRLPRAVLALDATGIGTHIGQQLHERFRRRVIALKIGSRPEGLPPQDRSEFVTEFKRALEAGEVELGSDREQTLQFRRTKILSAGKVEQRGSKKKTHYDKAWATMYAWYGTRVGRRRSVYERRALRVLSIGR